MNQKSDNTVLIDIKDLFFVIIRKIGLIAIAGVIVACILGCYRYFSLVGKGVSNKTANDYLVLNVDSKLIGESDAEYNDRIIDVNRAHDLVNSINIINNQIDNNRKYTSDSVFMQIDPENEAITTVSMMFTTDRTQLSGAIITLGSTYEQYINSGEYLNSFSENIGISQGYLAELITASYKSNSFIVSNEGDDNNIGTVTIVVIGPTTDFTDELMDSIIVNVENKCNELNNSIPHTISIVSRQSSYKVDSTTRDRQFNISNRFESLQHQITTYDNSIDTIASKLGVGKDNVYEYFHNDSPVDGESNINPLSSLKKYAVLGFAVGIFMSFVVIVYLYFVGKKFSTQSKFFCRFNDIKKIGVAKPEYKRSVISKLIDVKTGDDSNLSKDKHNKVIAANIKNLTNGMNKIAFVGTAENIKVNQFVNDLGINASIMNSFFEDPNSLELINNFDGVILVEQRNYSKIDTISEELDLIANTHAKLIGAVII